MVYQLNKEKKEKTFRENKERAQSGSRSGGRSTPRSGFPSAEKSREDERRKKRVFNQQRLNALSQPRPQQKAKELTEQEILAKQEKLLELAERKKKYSKFDFASFIDRDAEYEWKLGPMASAASIRTGVTV